MPSVVVPVLKWSDQPLFGGQLERQRLGACVLTDLNDFEGAANAIGAAVRRVLTDPSIRRACAAARTTMSNEHGIVVATASIEACLCKRVAPSSTADVEFCQRHCVACNTRLRRLAPGARRQQLGWDLHFQPSGVSWCSIACHAILYALVAYCAYWLFFLR